MINLIVKIIQKTSFDIYGWVIVLKKNQIYTNIVFLLIFAKKTGSFLSNGNISLLFFNSISSKVKLRNLPSRTGIIWRLTKL
jgi:hypothetical protein